jgi:hypothetical protein
MNYEYITRCVCVSLSEKEVRFMNIQYSRSIVLLLALIVCSLAVPPPRVSAQDDNTANDGLIGISDDTVVAATTLPVLWSAGGLSAGTNSAGQSALIATDASGNVAVVSGPANARDLAVTSYTAAGTFRWRNTITPSVGTFRGGWIAVAPNGDFVALGYYVDSHGYARSSILVRYASDGTLQWRTDIVGVVARLIVDAAGNTFLAFGSSVNGVGAIQLHKYNPSGVLLWANGVPVNGSLTSVIATSLALSPDGADVMVTGDVPGGALWVTAAYDTATGTRRWVVVAPEGIANLDVVVDAGRVYVTGEGNVGTSGFLTVVAYDRATGARVWRTDANPPVCCAYATRIANAPDGSLVVAGRTSSGGYFDWWIVSLNTNGSVRWQARRDAAQSGDEMPAAVFVLADGTTVVSGVGGPVIRDILGNQYMQGVTVGYSPNGTLLWEAFSRLPTVWATSLPNGDVCATGGYDALITCWRPSGGVIPNQPPIAVMSANPLSGPAPLTVTFDGSGSTDPDGSVTSWLWSFGDGTSGIGAVVTHTYTTMWITYYPSLTVVDNRGASSWIAGPPITVNAPPPPAAPSLLTASTSGASVVLNWQDNSSDEIGFYIERCVGAGCTDFIGLFGDTPANVTTFTDSLVVAGITYRYRVVAFNAGGYSPYSNVATVSTGGTIGSPVAPSGLVGQGVSRSQIALTWSNNNKIQDGVAIERCQGSTCTNFVQVATIAGTATTHNDSGLAANTIYRYRVRAFNSSGNSPYSNVASARTLKR